MTMSFHKILRKNKTTITILLFLFLFTMIHIFRPLSLYNENGSFREFGVGYRNKTVFPIWLVAIILAIGCYLCVCYMVNKRLV